MGHAGHADPASPDACRGRTDCRSRAAAAVVEEVVLDLRTGRRCIRDSADLADPARSEGLHADRAHTSPPGGPRADHHDTDHRRVDRRTWAASDADPLPRASGTGDRRTMEERTAAMIGS